MHGLLSELCGKLLNAFSHNNFAGVKVVNAIHDARIPGPIPALTRDRDAIEASWDTSLKAKVSQVNVQRLKVNPLRHSKLAAPSYHRPIQQHGH
jgi:hypothetical protein